MSIKKVLTASIISLTAIGCLSQKAISNADEYHGYWVNGRILDAYNRLGGYGFYGNATIPESTAANGGKYQSFEKGSSIFWNPSVDNGNAHQLGGRIRDKWSDNQWERGYLKYPLTDESPTRSGNGRFNHFQGGSIYWSPETDAHTIQGQIRDRWAASGWETGVLGFPTTDENGTPNRPGKYNHFENGSIYWSPSTPAQPVLGSIRDYWSKLGWENSRFGFPTTGSFFTAGGSIQQNFEHQNLQWVPDYTSALSPYNMGYSSYTYDFLLINQDERWTPQSVNREVTTHFNKYFPFSGCPEVLQEGAVCSLKTAIGIDAPIRIQSISNEGFSIRSLEGHPEGANRDITFRFFYNPDAATTINMTIYASGEVSGASYLGPLNSATVARVSWLLLAHNIMERISTSDLTYITPDKSYNSQAAPRMGFAPPSAPNASVAPTEAINPEKEEISYLSNNVPLFPLDASDGSIEAYFRNSASY